MTHALCASIVIPTHNPSDVFGECVSAVYAQVVEAGASLELIVVDNNSSPGRHAYIKNVLQRFHSPQITQRLIVEPTQGAGNARLRGIHEARNDFVGCLDDDNVARPDWLTAGVRTLRTNSCAAAVTGLLLPPSWAPTAESFAACHEPFALRTAPADRCFKYDTLRGQAPPSAGCVVRRSAVISAIRAFPPLLLGLSKKFPLTAEDTELFMRLGQQGWEVWHNPELVCTHAIAPARFTPGGVRKLMRGIGLAHSPLRLVRTQSTLDWVMTMPLIMGRDFLQLIRETVVLAREGGDVFRRAHAWRLFYAVQSPLRGNFHVLKAQLCGKRVSLDHGTWTEVPLDTSRVTERVTNAAPTATERPGNADSIGPHDGPPG